MAHFTPQLFDFLRELKANNNRDWFQANKPRYEAHVKGPVLQFIADFAPHLTEISPHYQAIPKASGGSMFRIYRDVRFSADKSPYKTAAAVHFRHEVGKSAHAPGFYLHLEPDNVMVGCGIWRPDSKTAGKIRAAIAARPDDWRAAVSNPDFSAGFKLDGESLKRPPRGFDSQHPLIDDLKRKDFIAAAPSDEATACADDFLAQYADLCRRAGPMVEFLTTALGLPY